MFWRSLAARRSFKRQQTYLQALKPTPRVEAHFGKFNVHTVWLPLDMPSRWRVPVLKTEEKGSDVNLATHLLFDAFNGETEMAVVLSNDSDLREPIRIVQSHPFDMVMWVVNPLQRSKTGMEASYHIDLNVADVRDSQFPDRVTLGDGRVHERPTAWR